MPHPDVVAERLDALRFPPPDEDTTALRRELDDVLDAAKRFLGQAPPETAR